MTYFNKFKKKFQDELINNGVWSDKQIDYILHSFNKAAKDTLKQKHKDTFYTPGGKSIKHPSIKHPRIRVT